jgi:site-specific DNA-adenine methylase
MRYVGSKAKLAEHLVPYVQAALRRAKTNLVYEPFCGGLSMTTAIVERVPLVQVEASDVAPGLITLYQAVQMGWSPPTTMSKERWTELRERKGEDDKLVAFAGFGCSYNGIYFTGYGDTTFARSAHNGLKRKLKACSKVRFVPRPYQDLNVSGSCVIYCDPPYRDTDSSAYRSLRGTAHAKFDSDAFWRWVRTQAAYGAHILVSEYSGPTWAKVVWEKSVATTMSTRTAGQAVTATERLYYVGPKSV